MKFNTNDVRSAMRGKGPSGVRGFGACSVALLSVVALAACSNSSNSAKGSGTGSSAATESLSIAAPVTDASISQLWVAQQAGFFTKRNVKVKIDIVGTNVASAVVSGQDDLGQLGIPAPLTVAHQGKPTSVVYSQLGKLAPAFLVGGPSIRTVNDCRTLASQPLGTGNYGYAEAYKVAFKAKFRHLSFSDIPTISASVASGRVDCAVNTLTQFTSAIAAKKVHIIVDPRDPSTVPLSVRSLHIPEATIWGINKVVASKSEAVVRFLAAMQDALKLMRSKTPEELATLLLANDQWKAIDRTTLISAIKNVSYAWGPDDGMIMEQYWSSTLAFEKSAGLTFIDPNSSDWSYAKRIDMSYLKKANALVAK